MSSDTLQRSLVALNSFRREFHIQNVTIDGENATVNGSYSGYFVAGPTRTPSNGIFQASLRKMGIQWFVYTLTM